MRLHKQPDFEEMLLLNQHHFINMCKNERTPLQLNFKSYMENYPKCQGYFHDIPPKKLTMFSLDGHY